MSETLKNNETDQLGIGGVIPRFCFICGSELEECGLGWMQYFIFNVQILIAWHNHQLV